MSSFTSSSDPGSEATASDTRPSIVAILMIGTSLIAALAAAEACRLAITPADHQRICGQDRTSIRTVVIGDSTELAAIDSHAIGPDCVNLSISGSGFATWEPILTSAVRELPELQTVIMSADPMSVLRDGFGPRHHDYSDLYACGALPSDIKGMAMDKQTSDYVRYKSPLRILCAGPRLTWTGLCSFLRRLQVLPREAGPFTRRQGAEKKSGYVQMFSDKTQVGINLAALRRLLSLIQEHQLDLVLVRTPVTRSFYQTRQAEWESWHGQILAVVDESLGTGRAATISLEQPDGFSLQDFWDPNHLNEAGKNRFSELLRSRLKLTSR